VRSLSDFPCLQNELATQFISRPKKIPVLVDGEVVMGVGGFERGLLR
jgi:hypothetical protein